MGISIGHASKPRLSSSLLVERVDYDGRDNRLSITFRPSGIQSLADELTQRQEEKTQTTSTPILLSVVRSTSRVVAFAAAAALPAVQPPEPVVREPGRVLRGLDLHAPGRCGLDERLRRGDLASYAEVAELGHVTRARVSQILNLINLSPEIQQALLFLPRTVRGRDPIIVRDLQPIASTLDWRRQRVLWQQLIRHDPRLGDV